MLDIWFLIIFLAIITYTTRIIGIIFMGNRKMNPTIELYFSYVPAGIIASLIVSQLFVKDSNIPISIPVLAGGFMTIILIKTTKSFLLSIVIGIIVGTLTRYFLN